MYFELCWGFGDSFLSEGLLKHKNIFEKIIKFRWNVFQYIIYHLASVESSSVDYTEDLASSGICSPNISQTHPHYGYPCLQFGINIFILQQQLLHQCWSVTYVTVKVSVPCL